MKAWVSMVQATLGAYLLNIVTSRPTFSANQEAWFLGRIQDVVNGGT